MLEVRLRGGFSDRNGIKSENTEIQIDSLDERTRKHIANLLSDAYRYVYSRGDYYAERAKQTFYKFIIGDVYVLQTDCYTSYSYNQIFDKINETILCDDYDAVLTVVEAIVEYWENYLSGIGFENHQIVSESLNGLFEKEYVGYRFVDGYITKVTDDVEIKEINEALNNPYSEVRTHINKANQYLSDRNHPDYENSIKESISSVEKLVEILLNKKGTLGELLDQLNDKEIEIHGALIKGFKALFGYTSDAKGIRHGGEIDGKDASFEEAKFMLVSCCAFVNYLISLQAKIK